MPSTVTIQPGALGADFYALTPQIAATLLDRKVAFVARYVGNGSSGKHVTTKPLSWDPKGRTEVEWYHSNGIAFLAIYERSADDIKGGALAGLKAGKAGSEGARLIGYPPPLAITACADTDVTDANLASAIDYCRAFADATAVAGYTQTSLYGDEDIAAAWPADIVCIPGALFWSRRLWQRIKANAPFGLKVTMIQKLDQPNRLDWLTVYAPFDAWLPTPDVPPPVPDVVTPPRTLRYGMKGDDVKALQARLGLKEWGVFGPITLRAVKRFQALKGLKVDGIVGPQTWGKLDKATS